MLFFFDYLYYKIFKIYSKINDGIPKFTAVLIVSGMQTFNVVALIDIFSIIKHNKFLPEKLFFIGFITILIIINYIRYKSKHNLLVEKWIKESLSQQTIRGTLILLYVIVSTVSVFALSIYLGSKKW